MPRLKGIRKRGRMYVFRIRYGKNRERQIKLGRVLDVALTRLLEIRRAQRRGEELPQEPPPTLTVAQASDRWLEEHVRHNRTAQNYKDAAARVRRFLKPFMGETRMDKVTVGTLVAYRHWLEGRRHPKTDKPLTSLTVKHVLGDCRCMLNHSLNTGLLERSPIPTRGWLPKIPQRAPDRFTRKEREILVALPEPFGWVLRFLLATGIRWGEMVRAQASDITEGVLLIRKSKSGKIRRVPIPAELLEETKHRVGRLCPFDYSGNFNARVRELIAEHIKTLPEGQRKALEGLKRFHVHLTRHTFASEWREAGGSLAALQRILGHSTIRVTEQYGEIADDMVLREFRRIEAEAAGTKAGTKPERKNVNGGGTGI